jgi:hypothetical protein
VRSVELAIYADTLAGEAASLAARAERARSRLRQAAIEKRARGELSETTVARLDALGLFGGLDELARRDRHEQPAVLVVGGEEVGRHGLHVADPRPQLELLAHPAHAPLER